MREYCEHNRCTSMRPDVKKVHKRRLVYCKQDQCTQKKRLFDRQSASGPRSSLRADLERGAEKKQCSGKGGWGNYLNDTYEYSDEDYSGEEYENHEDLEFNVERTKISLSSFLPSDMFDGEHEESSHFIGGDEIVRERRFILVPKTFQTKEPDMSMGTRSKSLVPKYKEKLLGAIKKVDSPEDKNTVVTNVPKKEKVKKRRLTEQQKYHDGIVKMILKNQELRAVWEPQGIWKRKHSASNNSLVGVGRSHAKNVRNLRYGNDRRVMQRQFHMVTVYLG